MRQHLDLFSGLGGFALAANSCGVQTIGFVESDKFCSRILENKWKGVPIHDNIKTFDARPFRGVWLATAGFPCQPFSNSGKQQGEDDDRYLWPETLAAITQARPRWVLLENVAGIINLALDQVLADLEGESYETGTLVLPACSKNAPHRRSRVWIICRDVADPDQLNADGGRYGASEILRPEQEPPNIQGGKPNVADTNQPSGKREHPSQGRRRSGEQFKGRDDVERGSKDVAHAASKRQPRQGQPFDASNSAANGKESIAQPVNGSVRNQRRIKSGLGFVADGIPNGLLDGTSWNAEPEGLPRIAAGVKNRADKLKAIGNSIVWPLAAELIETMIRCEEIYEQGIEQ